MLLFKDVFLCLCTFSIVNPRDQPFGFLVVALFNVEVYRLLGEYEHVEVEGDQYEWAILYNACVNDCLNGFKRALRTRIGR